MCGAAEDTPSLSRQRVGDQVVLGRDTRRGAHAMRESFTRLCRPERVPVTGLAGGTKVYAFSRILSARRGRPASQETVVAQT